MSFPKPRAAPARKNFVSFKRGAVLHPECEWLWPEIAKLSERMFLRARGKLSSPVLRREVHKGSSRLVLKEVFKEGQPLYSVYPPLLAASLLSPDSGSTIYITLLANK